MCNRGFSRLLVCYLSEEYLYLFIHYIILYYYIPFIPIKGDPGGPLSGLGRGVGWVCHTSFICIGERGFPRPRAVVTVASGQSDDACEREAVTC